MRASDVELFEAAWKARDVAGLKALAPRIGCVLDVKGLLVLGAVPGLPIADVAVIAAQACRDPVGIVLREYASYAREKVVVLAWCDRARERITIGAVRIMRTATIGTVWPLLKPWYKEVARNAAHVRLWAALEDEDRVRFALAPLEADPEPQTTEDLVRQIVANPDDIALRAVLADAFLERDDPRGELMRLALEPETPELAARIAALEAQHGPTLAKDVTDHVAAYKLRGGFVDSITLTAPKFVKEGAAMLDAQPIRTVIVEPVDARTFATLAKAPARGRIRALRLEGDRWRPRTLELAAFPAQEASALAEVTFYGCNLEGPMFDGFAPPALATLAIEHCTIDPVAMRSLLRGPATRVRALTMQGARTFNRGTLDHAGFLEAFDDAELALETISVRDMHFSTDDWVGDLVVRARRLSSATLDVCGPRVANAIAMSPSLASVKLWSLPTPEGLAKILQSTSLRNLVLYGPMFEKRPDEADVLARVLLALPATHGLATVYLSNTSHEAALAARFGAVTDY